MQNCICFKSNFSHFFKVKVRKQTHILCALWRMTLISRAHFVNCVFNMPVSAGVLPQTLCTTNPHLHSNESFGREE